MAYPTDRKYTKEARMDSGQLGTRPRSASPTTRRKSLGDIVFVELPKVGAELTAGKTFGTVESVKAVSDLFAPASGTVTEINADLATSPEKVNKDRARLLDGENHAEESGRTGWAALRRGL